MAVLICCWLHGVLCNLSRALSMGGGFLCVRNFICHLSIIKLHSCIILCISFWYVSRASGKGAEIVGHKESVYFVGIFLIIYDNYSFAFIGLIIAFSVACFWFNCFITCSWLFCIGVFWLNALIICFSLLAARMRYVFCMCSHLGVLWYVLFLLEDWHMLLVLWCCSLGHIWVVAFLLHWKLC